MNQFENSELEIPEKLCIIPLRDVVVFPYMILPLLIGRSSTIEAVDAALSLEQNQKFVLLLTQRNSSVEEPEPDDLHNVGTIATIMRMLKLPDGKVKVLVQGIARARVTEYVQTKPFLVAQIEQLEVDLPVEHEKETQALVHSVRAELEKAQNFGKNFPPEIMLFINNIDDPGRLADIIIGHLNVSDINLEQAQAVLELATPYERLLKVLEMLSDMTQVLDLQHQIMSQAKGEMDKLQKDFLLRQQMKAIQDELGEGDDLRQEVEEYRRKIHEARMSKEVRKVAEKQLRRLEMMHPESAESGVVRTYLDWLVELPWSKSSRDRLELSAAQKTLDDDHYGLDKVKTRIVEYLAVRKLQKRHKGPILCFVGPPGVGKTSLGRSIARALGRKFHRISLGGVRDEAEIRGHRRTYVGALPGRIVQGIRQCGTNNPVFMMDEVDKIGADFRGDPSAALLEVLDPEQNHEFRDHYLEVNFDLSKVLFITTANLLEPIHPAFIDRMEVIQIPGYIQEEKIEIARRYLIPRQIRENGISEKVFELTPEGLDGLITNYTREAGVRNLERTIGSLCRKVARRVAEGNSERVVFHGENLQEFLGAPVFIPEDDIWDEMVGVVRGLAVTSAGGDVLTVEATLMRGKGNLILTGHLGDVMKESAQAALSFVRSRAELLDIDPEMFQNYDVHIHVPEGATPKDGPSAGITMGTVLISAFTKRPVPFNIAMTGEVTLTGRVLRIGGVKEKFLAAKRYGAQHLLLPKANYADYQEMAPEYREGVEVHFVETMDDVIKKVFHNTPIGKKS
jgi:ATP-dependent Lon protease